MERGEIFMAQKLKQINDISIGDNLRKLRNAANLTQEQVVAQLQLRNLPTSRSVYSQIEAGTYNIRISELIALPLFFRKESGKCPSACSGKIWSPQCFWHSLLRSFPTFPQSSAPADIRKLSCHPAVSHHP